MSAKSAALSESESKRVSADLCTPTPSNHTASSLMPSDHAYSASALPTSAAKPTTGPIPRRPAASNQATSNHAISNHAISNQAISDQGTLGQVTPEALSEEALEKAIDEALEPLIKGDFHSRWDSAKQFSRRFAHLGDCIVPYLIHHLQSQSDPDIQWFLIRILSQFDRPAVVEAIAHILVSSPSEDLQVEAGKALTTLGASAITTLSRLLAAEVPGEQRLLAARALAHIRRSATIEPLLSIATDPNSQLRAIATEALGSFHSPRVTPILLNALNDEPAICTEAIRALGRRRDLLGSTDLVTPLKKCLYAVDEAIARESAIALGRLGDESAANALGYILTQPIAASVKIAAVRALAWLGTPVAIQLLTETFSCDSLRVAPAVTREIAKALGQTRSAPLKPQAAQPLIAWLQAQQPSAPDNATRHAAPNLAAPNLAAPNLATLKQAVVSALARLGQIDAIDSLIPALADPEPRIKMHVLSALHQIDPRVAQAKIQDYLNDAQISPELKRQVKDSLVAL
ncbi:MAG: HEAT repeat domain-containing protein [Cyanobacteria bacterium J06627_32]